MNTEINEPRVRVVMGAKRVFWASLTAAQVLKNEHARNQVKWPGPDGHKKKPRRMTELAGQVMRNEIDRQTRHRRLISPGERFGRLLVVSLALECGVPLKWNCRCDCGVEKQILGKRLQDGNTRSCGCLRREITSAIGKKQLGRRWHWKARKAAA